MFLQKISGTPIFIAFPATKLKTGVRFHLLDAGFFKESNFEKRVALGDSGCFHPKTPIMRKPEKYIDPSRLAIPIRLSVMFPLKRQPKKTHTHTNEQPRHEVEKQHQDRTIKERESQDDDEH